MQINPTEFRERLARLDTCVLSDALDRLGLPGVVTGISRLSTDRAIAGRVLTVKLEPANGRSAEQHNATAAVESAEPGDVIVVEQRSRPDVAAWGGMLSLAAKLRNVGGAICEGPCRDIDESRRADFAVFGRGTVPTTARGRVIETGFNVPVKIGDLTVSHGDWAVADGSGVVFLRAAEAERILTTAEDLAAQERDMVAAIKAGTPVSKVMAGNYERMLES
jgi:4-hydroxy-4-methyl-2-oxoglutarate aldolase